MHEKGAAEPKPCRPSATLCRQHVDRPYEQPDDEGEAEEATDGISDKRAVVVLARHLKSLSLVSKSL